VISSTPLLLSKALRFVPLAFGFLVTVTEDWLTGYWYISNW